MKHQYDERALATELEQRNIDGTYWGTKWFHLFDCLNNEEFQEVRERTDCKAELNEQITEISQLSWTRIKRGQVYLTKYKDSQNGKGST